MSAITLPIDVLAGLRAGRVAKHEPFFATLEELITSPEGFGITTATPVQRAICRVSDGLPIAELWDDPNVRAAFGLAEPEEFAPRWLVILAAIRSLKSIIAAAKAIQCSQECDLSSIAAGDQVRIPVLSTDKDTAGAVYGHIVGNLREKPRLRKLLACEPTADSVWLRHPSGRRVEIKVTALSRAGSTLVARWLAGCIFDEAPRMVGEEDGIKNLDEALHAIQGRLLPGAQVLLIGSPWAPFGPVYDLVQEHFGKPSRKVVVARAPGPVMNPYYWTPERCEQVRQDDPIAHKTDVLGEFADPESSLFSDAVLRAITRTEPAELAPDEHHTYVAAIDPATRSNAWTLSVGTRLRDGRNAQVLAREWVPKGKPLDPDVVLEEIAGILLRYRVRTVRTDQWSVDALAAVARRHGLSLASDSVTAARRFELYDGLRVQTEIAKVELCPVKRVHDDLVRVRKKLTQDGLRIVLPTTADGRHCDFAPPTVLIFEHPIAEPRPLPLLEGSAEWSAVERLRLRQAEITKREKRLRRSRNVVRELAAGMR